MSTLHPSIGGIPLVLGGNVFGWTAKGEDGFAVLDTFYEAGGRMIDTADIYSAWIEGHVGGESERLIGQWLELRGVRQEMLIHTKTGMFGDPEKLKPAAVASAIDASLDRLRTDYIDLYYAHCDYEELAPEVIVEALSATVASGKAREIGCSNYSAARVLAMLDAAGAAGVTPFTVLQNQYNLVARQDYGPDLQAICTSRDMAMLPFFGLASGYLSGKYRKPEDFEGSDRSYRVRDYAESGPAVLAVMDAIAAETGANLPAIALAWLVRQPGIPAPIASARSPGQLAELLEFTRVELTTEQLDRLTSTG